MHRHLHYRTVGIKRLGDDQAGILSAAGLNASVAGAEGDEAVGIHCSDRRICRAPEHSGKSDVARLQDGLKLNLLSRYAVDFLIAGHLDAGRLYHLKGMEAIPARGRIEICGYGILIRQPEVGVIIAEGVVVCHRGLGSGDVDHYYRTLTESVVSDRLDVMTHRYCCQRG